MGPGFEPLRAYRGEGRRQHQSPFHHFRRDGRVVDCTGLENRRTERYRGFESLSLRFIFVKPADFQRVLIFIYSKVPECYFLHRNPHSYSICFISLVILTPPPLRGIFPIWGGVHHTCHSHLSKRIGASSISLPNFNYLYLQLLQELSSAFIHNPGKAFGGPFF